MTVIRRKLLPEEQVPLSLQHVGLAVGLSGISCKLEYPVNAPCAGVSLGPGSAVQAILVFVVGSGHSQARALREVSTMAEPWD